MARLALATLACVISVSESIDAGYHWRWRRNIPNLLCVPTWRPDGLCRKENWRRVWRRNAGGERGFALSSSQPSPLEPGSLLSSTTPLAFFPPSLGWFFGSLPSSRRIVYSFQSFLNHFILERPSQKERGTSVLCLLLAQVGQCPRAKWRTRCLPYLIGRMGRNSKRRTRNSRRNRQRKRGTEGREEGKEGGGGRRKICIISLLRYPNHYSELGGTLKYTDHVWVLSDMLTSEELVKSRLQFAILKKFSSLIVCTRGYHNSKEADTYFRPCDP